MNVQRARALRDRAPHQADDAIVIADVVAVFDVPRDDIGHALIQLAERDDLLCRRGLAYPLLQSVLAMVNKRYDCSSFSVSLAPSALSCSTMASDECRNSASPQVNIDCPVMAEYAPSSSSRGGQPFVR